MLVIRAGQIDAVEQRLRVRIQEEFAARLKADFPEQTAPLSETELRVQVADGYQAAEALAITDRADIYRFLKLRFLPPAALESSVARLAFYRVLTDPEKDAGRRLDFIERHIALESGKAVP
jgi:hypothetical protein